MEDLVSTCFKWCVVFPHCGLIHLYAGSSVQRMTGRNMQNHPQREKKKKKEQEKAVRGGDREAVLLGGW